MTTLILVRHAQSTPTPDAPERDWPLSERGRQQALSLAPVLAELGVDVLASSPYQRAIDTLAPYAAQAGLDTAVHEDLGERRLGGWIESVEAVDAAIARMHADPDYCLDGGETGRACTARFGAALQSVLAAHPGRTIAVGSHGGVIGHLLGATVGYDALPPAFWRSIRNPHLFVFDASDGLTWRAERTLDGQAGVRA
ncbi:MAG TPA: histidine phosphatase family protein [Caulobacteraceae bacterium]|jgi:2,3-bisphosphoglycerate-dependent phosphoglycerate mutase